MKTMRTMIEIKNAEEYLSKFTSENTKKAALTLLKKLARYIENDLENVRFIEKFKIDMFIKKELNGKSESTISNTISRLKDLCSFYNNDAASHLTLDYVKSITKAKTVNYLTPYQVYRAIEDLLNYQDKALVLLCYLGCYDNEFKTIRNLREDQFKGDYLLLDNGKKIMLNQYCSNIINKAIKEYSVRKYTFLDKFEEVVYELKYTGYIIKAGDRRDYSYDVVANSTLRNRFQTFAKAIGIEDFSAVMLKNSKYLYDLVKLECTTNFGFDINQDILAEYCKDNNMKGSIAKLNISKREIKFKIIEEIANKQDIIHQ